MKFSEDATERHSRVQSYGDGWIQANNQRLERGFIIHKGGINDDWEPCRYADLKPEHLLPALALKAELILIGTGKQQHLPTPALHQALTQNQTGFEFMTTDAACRTYNVLLSEAREVVAILFPE